MSKFHKNTKSLSQREENQITNKAGGVGFKIENPIEKLITICSARLDITEVKFYDKEFKDGLSDTTIEFLKVADLISAEDLLILASWLRNDMNLRVTPQILMAIASIKDKTILEKYSKNIIIRPDDIKNGFLGFKLYSYFLINYKDSPKIKHPIKRLKKIWADYIKETKLYKLLKYNTPQFPTWADLLKYLPRGKNYPVSKPVADYFLNGTITEESPIELKLRKELFAMENFDEKAKELAIKANIPFLSLLSQFPNQKSEIYNTILENNQMGYMAILKSVRNFLKYNLHKDILQKVANKLTDEKEVLESRQLPFRFYSAFRETKDYEEENNINPEKEKLMLDAIIKACDISLQNVPELLGKTCIMVDNSGSMSNSLSNKSSLTCADAGNMIGAIFAKKSNGIVISFGEKAKNIPHLDEPILMFAEKINDTNVGCLTNTHKAFEILTKNKIKVDRIILISDMQCWNSNHFSSDSEMNTQKSYKNYVEQIKEEPYLHSIHINGYGENAINPEGFKKVFTHSGFSEKLINIIHDLETNIEQKEETTSWEEIKKKWQVK